MKEKDKKAKKGETMKARQRMIKVAESFARPFCVTDGRKFRLKDINPGDTAGLKAEDKPRAKEALTNGVSLLAEFQDKLYAQDQWGLLLIFRPWTPPGRTAPSSTSCPA